MARQDGEATHTAMKATSNHGIDVVVSAAVLAETLRGGPEDARINQLLKSILVAPVTEGTARMAARLKRACGLNGVASTIDAIVVATSMDFGGGAILTSDPDDINRLGEAVPRMRIRAIAV
jgi:predicted nucleic acid-binding protein